MTDHELAVAISAIAEEGIGEARVWDRLCQLCDEAHDRRGSEPIKSWVERHLTEETA